MHPVMVKEELEDSVPPENKMNEYDFDPKLDLEKINFNSVGKKKTTAYEVDPESVLNHGRGNVGIDLAGLLTPEQEEEMSRLYEENPALAEVNDIKGTGSNAYRPAEAWIQTYSGRRFNPTNPVTGAIVIQDIAHALSMQCRFSGHVKKFYSVAQHSVNVSYICDQADALWGLMHDASEAYLVDIPSPLKRSGKFESYKELEAHMQKAICERFDLPIVEPPSVKRADTILLATEARDLMSPLHPDWIQPCEPLPFKIEPLSQQDAKNLFMKRFFELTIGKDYMSHYEHYLRHDGK